MGNVNEVDGKSQRAFAAAAAVLGHVVFRLPNVGARSGILRVRAS